MFYLTDIALNYSGVSILSLLFLVAVGVIVARSHMVDKQVKRGFLLCIAMVGVVLVTDWFTVVTDGVLPALRVAHTWASALMFSLAPAIPVVLASAIIKGRQTRLVTAVLAAHAMLEVVTAAGANLVFWVDKNNLYHRGPLYSVYILLYVLGSVYLVVESIRASRMYQTHNDLMMGATIVCLASGVIMQTLVPAVHTSWSAVSMALLLYFAYYCDTTQQTDALTMLLNRRSWDGYLERPQAPSVVVSLDVDDFKTVNDTQGHLRGDDYLRGVADKIRQVYGPVGLCYRTGGDEFMVVMNKRLDEAPRLRSELNERLANAKDVGQGRLGVSVGWARCEESTRFAQAVDEADRMMYADKRARKAGR